MREREIQTILTKSGLPVDLAPRIMTMLTEASETTTGFATALPPTSTQDGAPAPSARVIDETGRYLDRGRIGLGGMGEVRRVYDRRFDRVLAMKILRSEISGDESLVARFFTEAQVTAQLQHPAIVPVHDYGRLSDGRVFFTMKEVRGRTLTDVIREVPAAPVHPPGVDADPGVDGGWRVAASGWTFRRMLGAFQRACEGVAYAHSHGVIHRDLKPANVMIGDYGEVLVLDWGLTRAGTATGEQGERIVAGESLPARALTEYGTITGTPGYMPPEQASGDPALITPASDVYALGATLYHLLSGSRPYADVPSWSIFRHFGDPPTPLPDRVGNDPAGPLIPVELRRICEVAMHGEVARRCSITELGQQIGEWLEGAQRRARAMELLAEARRVKPRAEQLRSEARDLRARADAMLVQVPPFAPVEAKQSGWELQDRARALERDADLATVRLTQVLRASLTHAPDFEVAHAMLADHYQQEHADAEARRDLAQAARYEALLADHDRGRWEAYRRGVGALTIVTSSPGASITVCRYEEEGRRLVPRHVGSLGATPLFERQLPMGSYLVTIQQEGHHEVRYPVSIGRQQHWDGVPTAGNGPYPIYLPQLGELDAEDCYVPAGWFWSGGDAEAANSLPAARLWLPGFVMRRFPVTIAEFNTFLNDLVTQGRADEALAYAPPAPAWEEAQGRQEFGIERGPDGRFFYPGPAARLRWPIAMVNWEASAAYAAWFAEREGKPWRLVAEMEHEKASRGVDARFFPWGNFLDPTFCKMRHSSVGDGRNLRATVDDFPVDESPYGVRGLAGNVHSWCVDPYQTRGPKTVSDVPQISDGSDVQGPGAGGVHRVLRGGSWRDPEANLRGAYRDAPPATYRDTVIGFRLARPFPGVS